MRSLLVPLLFPALVAAQDSAKVKAVKVQTDSLRAETCRGGTLRSNGTCSGRKLAPRTTVVYRLAGRIDSIVTLPPIIVQPPPPPPDTTTPTPTPPPPTGGVAELPRVYLNFPYPTPTRTVQVVAGASLQAALDAAQRGDELVLASGATWTGNYRVTSCGAGWITVRASGALPSGGRMRPSLAASVAKVVTPNNEAALVATSTSCRWRFVGFEVSVAPSVTATVYGIVRMEGSESVLDRMYVHGAPSSQIARCVTMNGTRQAVESSWISDCHGTGFDSQAIHGGLGAGPFRIVDNYLEGAGENIMFGGQDPQVAGLVPSDIEIRRNHFRKPDTWRGAGWDIKNHLELKNAVRVLIEGNVFEGSWAGAQEGVSVVFMSANQAGGCRWCRVTDITFRKALIRNAGSGINVATARYWPLDSTTRRIHISDVVVDSAGYVPWASEGNNRRALQVLSGVDGVTFDRVLITGARLRQSLWVEGGSPLAITNGVWAPGQYGVSGSGYGGANALQHFAPGYVWTNMTILGASSTGFWPTGTLFAASETAVPLAAQIRDAVRQATAGVVVVP